MEIGHTYYTGEEGNMFQIGNLVENLGHTARVIDILEDGSLLVRETGLSVDQRNAAEWVADPQRTRRVI